MLQYGFIVPLSVEVLSVVKHDKYETYIIAC